MQQFFENFLVAQIIRLTMGGKDNGIQILQTHQDFSTNLGCNLIDVVKRYITF
jgi:hypothetical protein